MKTLASLLVLGLVTSASAQPAKEDRSKNTGPVLPKWPVRGSKAPGMHKEMLRILKMQEDFTDKKILKIGVARTWKERELRDGSITVTQQWSTTIGVFDPQNNKCWVWEDLAFYRSPGSPLFHRNAGGAVSEINCARLK